jgi:hypothetical protein
MPFPIKYFEWVFDAGIVRASNIAAARTANQFAAQNGLLQLGQPFLHAGVVKAPAQFLVNQISQPIKRLFLPAFGNQPFGSSSR